MAGLDTRMLLGAQGVQAPDALQGYQQAMTLSSLANAQELQRQQLRDKQRADEEHGALRSVMGDLQAGGYSDDAIRAAMQKAPQAAPAILKEAIAARKARADEAKTGAETDVKRTENAAKTYTLFGGIAGNLAQQPTRENWLAAKGIAKRMGLDDSILDVPEGADPAQHFANIAEQSLSRAQQMEIRDRGLVRQETGRHNVATEGNTVRGQDLAAQTAANAQGLTRRGQDLLNARAIDARNDARAGAGKAPPGYRWKEDGSLEAIPGGPAALKADASDEKAEARKAGAVQKADIVIGKVDDALKQTGFTTTGATGAVMGKIPGTSAYDLRRTADTIKANLGFGELQAMREASPTGGALGQVAVQELAMLQATLASIDPDQSEAQLRKNLDSVKKHYQNWKNTLTGGAPAASAAAPAGTKGFAVRTPDGQTFTFPTEAAAFEFKQKAGIR